MQTDFYSSPSNQGDQALTQRLYSDHTHESTQNFSAFEELKKMVAVAPATEDFVRGLGEESACSRVLEARIQAFQAEQDEKTQRYLERATRREGNCLYYLTGWTASSGDDALYLTEQSRKATGGIFMRWNGKGIAINPGANFLKHFHAQGLHIRDLDYVIVTSDHPECYSDIKAIYELNYQINKASRDLQILHYFLNQKAFQALSSVLKPHFKQERNNLHSLELFLDSPEVEKIEIDPGIVLHYFQAASREAFPTGQNEKGGHTQNGLGIRLDLSDSKERMQIGYIAHSCWTSLMAHHLGSCDLLITGFGNTGAQDYQKLAYNSDSLGYFGTCTLLEEVAPRLVLCGEFGGREGDIRLEVIQKLRGENVQSKVRSIILPADLGLILNLRSLYVRCTVSGAWIEAAQVNVVKTSQAFGPLAYLAKSYVV